MKETTISIEDYIPFGKDNAVSREYLAALTQTSDREVRRMISVARKEHPIINLSDGNGYYRPTIEEYMDAKHFYAQEKCRVTSIIKSLSGIKKWIRSVDINGRTKDVCKENS